MHIYLLARSFSLRCLFALAAFSAIGGLPGEAWAYSILRLAAFTGAADGASPLGGVIVDGTGNLYGTTSAGAKGFGTVFKIVPGQPLKTLYTFCSQNSCVDGSSPRAAPVMDDLGNLYGTTWSGGAHDGGAVFEITRGGVEKVLYSFCAKIVGSVCADGVAPVAGLIRDKFGNLYGTTSLGGLNDVGVVFALSFDARSGEWVETVLYSFCPKGPNSGCRDGATPQAGLIMDTAGKLYGTTQLGGAHGQGVVFAIRPSLGSESVLYSFCAHKNCGDGSEPYAGLVIDKGGHLYGTTKYGGNPQCGNGGGVAFEVGPGVGAEKVLYAFCSRSKPPSDGDGSYPEAGLLMDASGNLYGTTATGGTSEQGVVFRVARRTESVLYSFCSRPGCGEFPVASVAMDKAGNLYGTTQRGGSGFGTVFELKK